MAELGKHKKTVTHAVIYGASDILGKAVGFLMLPIYTRYLTPTDYGVIEMLVLSIFLIDALLGMNMVQGVFRYFVLAKTEKDKKLVISNSFILTTSMSVVGAMLLVANADYVSTLMLGDVKYSELLTIFSILIITQSIGEQGLHFVRVQQKAVLFFWLSVFKLVLQLSLNIYFVVYLEMAVEGVVYSSCISTGVMALIGLVLLLGFAGVKFDFSVFKKLTTFSYPLWIGGALGYYVGMVDKYFIRTNIGLDDVGLYSLGAKFSTLVAVLVWGPFAKMWESHRYEVYKEDNAIAVFRMVFVGLMLGLLFVGLGISLFSKNVIVIMANESFWSASNIVPLLVVAAILQSVARFNYFGLFLNEKTLILSRLEFLKAVLITILLITLIPIFGLYGAAIASVIVTFVTMVLVVRKSTDEYDMQLPWGYIIKLSAYWVFCVSLSYFMPEELVASIISNIVILAVFVLGVIYLPFLRANEVNSIIEYLSVKARTVFSFK